MKTKLLFVFISFACILFPAVSMAQIIAEGVTHSLFLCDDGTVRGCGGNNSGCVGDGTSIQRTTPVQVFNLANINSISAGQYHSLALSNDSTVWGWGNNALGQLGDGTLTNRQTAIQVLSTYGGGIIHIAGGHDFSLALRRDGTVWSWGKNTFGQLGDSTTINKPYPIQVTPSFGGDITSIKAGYAHSLALKNDSTVWAWGHNSAGQLGDSTSINKWVPIQVHNLDMITVIATGYEHSLALKKDGTVWAWGLNEKGQLGDGTKINSSLPIKVPGLTGIIGIVAGNEYSLALKNDGTVWGWGWNFYGQLGDGTNTDRLSPVLNSSLSGVKEISSGYNHSFALKDDNSVWSWGWNAYGQLGDGSTTNKLTPVQVSGLCELMTELSEKKNLLSFNMFPNPATNEFKIEDSQFRIEEVEIYDVLGQIVFAQTSNFKPQTTIDISKLRGGIYFVQIKTQKFIETKKLIIAK